MDQISKLAPSFSVEPDAGNDIYLGAGAGAADAGADLGGDLSERWEGGDSRPFFSLPFTSPRSGLVVQIGRAHV